MKIGLRRSSPYIWMPATYGILVGGGICHRGVPPQTLTRQKKTFGGLRASMHDLSRRLHAGVNI